MPLQPLPVQPGAHTWKLMQNSLDQLSGVWAEGGLHQAYARCERHVPAVGVGVGTVTSAHTPRLGHKDLVRTAVGMWVGVALTIRIEQL